MPYTHARPRPSLCHIRLQPLSDVVTATVTYGYRLVFHPHEIALKPLVHNAAIERPEPPGNYEARARLRPPRPLRSSIDLSAPALSLPQLSALPRLLSRRARCRSSRTRRRSCSRCRRRSSRPSWASCTSPSEAPPPPPRSATRCSSSSRSRPSHGWPRRCSTRASRRSGSRCCAPPRSPHSGCGSSPSSRCCCDTPPSSARTSRAASCCAASPTHSRTALKRCDGV